MCTNGHVAKLFLELEFQHNGNKQMKKTRLLSSLAVFSAATDSENIIIQIQHGKGHIKKIWTELSSLGQEPTFKSKQELCKWRIMK